MVHNRNSRKKRPFVCMVFDIVINRLNATTYSVSTMSALHNKYNSARSQGLDWTIFKCLIEIFWVCSFNFRPLDFSTNEWTTNPDSRYRSSHLPYLNTFLNNEIFLTPFTQLYIFIFCCWRANPHYKLRKYEIFKLNFRQTRDFQLFCIWSHSICLFRYQLDDITNRSIP